ncbi:hypothetical protein Chor_012672 [Crotalus horridus]
MAETIRTATPFPMVSLFLVFTAFVISNIGHIRPQRTILAFVSGIFFILSATNCTSLVQEYQEMLKISSCKTLPGVILILSLQRGIGIEEKVAEIRKTAPQICTATYLEVGRSEITSLLPCASSPNPNLCLLFSSSGLSLVVGLVLYISSINDEVMNRPSGSEQYFQYRYGWSFAFAASSFLLKEGAGVMSVYLFTKRYAEEEMYRPHPAFYRPRLSDCSDYSGQFLHPEVWHRGRSPSDISSDVSIQMTQNYPPAIKYPEHMHISTSPC